MTMEEAAKAQEVQAQAAAQAQPEQASQAAASDDASKKASKRTTRSRSSTSTRKRASKKERVVVATSKRKSAVARAYVRKGTGIILVNSFDINNSEPAALRHLMLEPLHVSSMTEEASKGLDIKVNVRGGGQSGQAQAVRGAIAKGIAAYADNDAVRDEYMRYDRSMIIDDPRRVEPKKFKGPKARARFQKSYR